jgi:hypothetical protein
MPQTHTYSYTYSFTHGVDLLTLRIGLISRIMPITLTIEVGGVPCRINLFFTRVTGAHHATLPQPIQLKIEAASQSHT